jgi:hypothetical protein
LACKELTFRQKYFGQNLDTGAGAARLLGLHKEALDSELAGAFIKADYFWQRFHAELKILVYRDDFWDELGRVVGWEPGGVADPEQLRARLVTEVFTETHLACYRGHARAAEQLPPDSRAFVHFDYVKKLLPWTGVSGDALVGLLREPLDAQLSSLGRVGRWADAFELCRMILKYAPGNVECQEKMGGVYFAWTVGSLKGDSGGAASRDDADTLETAIGHLEKIRAAVPHSLVVYEMLGRLHQLRSVKLANAGFLSAALVDAQKALSFCPGSEEAERGRGELAELMKSTQAQMREIEKKMEKQGGPKLNARGQLLRAEAARGFGPVNEYIESAEARATVEASLTARARTLWREIGLPTPPERHDELARSLLEAVGRVLEDATAGTQDIAASWRNAAASDAGLADIAGPKVCDYLRRRLSPEASQQNVPPASAPAGEVAVLPVPGARMSKRGEPFGYWLFSRENFGVKARAALAVLLLLFAGGLWAREAWARSTRDAAYRHIVEAADKRQYAEVLDGAESFLSHLPLASSDARKPRVLAYYEEALARFVIQQEGGGLSPSAAARVDHYRQLVASTK